MSDSLQDKPVAPDSSRDEETGPPSSANNLQALQAAGIEISFIAAVIGVSEWQIREGYTEENQLGINATITLNDLAMTVKVLYEGGWESDRIEKSLTEVFSDKPPNDHHNGERRMDCIKIDPMHVLAWAHGEFL